MTTSKPAFAIAILLGSFVPFVALQRARAAEAPSPAVSVTKDSHGNSGTPVAPSLYRLGPGDEIKVQQANAEELDGKTARVNDEGFVNLPLVGRLQVGGLTIEETETLVTNGLSKLLVHPAPVVAITEYRSQPVSVLGEVNTPGVIQLQGRKTIVEMLSLAGGLKADAGTTVQITRRIAYGKLPLPGATVDAQNEYSMARLNLSALLKGSSNPAENIVIFPQDIISVPKADTVYITGDVKKPGGFPLTNEGGLSILQAVALAEGLGPEAAPKNAKIYRDIGPDQPKKEIAVNLQAIMQGKGSDVTLEPKDVLFIPDSASRKAGVKAAQLALSAATGLAWRF
jgi:polysaccharide biosynthesis/export protein